MNLYSPSLSVYKLTNIYLQWHFFFLLLWHLISDKIQYSQISISYRPSWNRNTNTKVDYVSNLQKSFFNRQRAQTNTFEHFASSTRLANNSTPYRCDWRHREGLPTLVKITRLRRRDLKNYQTLKVLNALIFKHEDALLYTQLV